MRLECAVERAARIAYPLMLAFHHLINVLLSCPACTITFQQSAIVHSSDMLHHILHQLLRLAGTFRPWHRDKVAVGGNRAMDCERVAIGSGRIAQRRVKTGKEWRVSRRFHIRESWVTVAELAAGGSTSLRLGASALAFSLQIVRHTTL